MDRNRLDRESGERDRLFDKIGKQFGRNPGAKSYIGERFFGFYWAVGHLANFIIQCMRKPPFLIYDFIRYTPLYCTVKDVSQNFLNSEERKKRVMTDSDLCAPPMRKTAKFLA